MKVNKFNATFVANGQTIQFRNIAMAKSKQYRQSEWSLTVKAGEFTGLRFAHTDGIKFDLKSVTYDIAFPLTNAAKIIVPDTGRHFMNTIYPRQVMFKDGGYLVSSAHMSTPFFVYLDGLEQVTLAFGLMGRPSTLGSYKPRRRPIRSFPWWSMRTNAGGGSPSPTMNIPTWVR